MNRIYSIPAILLAMSLLTASVAAADWRSTLGEFFGSKESAGTTTSQPALTDQEMNSGVLEALAVGIQRAIHLLGQAGGYLNDSTVRIPMPGHLQTVEKGLRAIGRDKYADQFIETMNRAAEKAVPLTRDIFMDTIRNMSLTDARNIVQGPDDAATQYFRTHSSDQLTAAILPIVKDATAEAGVTAAYKRMVGRMGFLDGVVDRQGWDLDRYVTGKALDGLFYKLAEEERLIRRDPVARTTDLLKKVFGSR